MADQSIADIIGSLAQAAAQQGPASPDPVYQRNLHYSQPAPMGGYLTKLDPLQEMAFQNWVVQNKVPFDPSPHADYDMRGFWKDLRAGGQHAQTGMNANDGKLHFNDHFKTPYHESFSAESKFAAPGAPMWNEQDQLVTPNAKIVFDERQRYGK